MHAVLTYRLLRIDRHGTSDSVNDAAQKRSGAVTNGQQQEQYVSGVGMDRLDVTRKAKRCSVQVTLPESLAALAAVAANLSLYPSLTQHIPGLLL